MEGGHRHANNQFTGCLWLCNDAQSHGRFAIHLWGEDGSACELSGGVDASSDGGFALIDSRSHCRIPMKVESGKITMGTFSPLYSGYDETVDYTRALCRGKVKIEDVSFRRDRDFRSPGDCRRGNHP